MNLQKTLHSYSNELVITLIWLVLIFFINPIGEFPLNDDWAYTKSVYNLYFNGYYKIEDWGIMTLVLHSYIGYFFCSIFGFSFTILRVSTLIIAFFTTILIYKICLYLSKNRMSSLFVTILLITNPLFINLSFSYMTDIPFLFFLLLSFYCFILYSETKKGIHFLLASLFVVCALLIRQLALILAVSFIFANFFQNKFKAKEFVLSFIPLLLCLLSLVIYAVVNAKTNFASRVYESKGSSIAVSSSMFSMAFLYFFVWQKIKIILAYLSVFLLPFTTYFFIRNLKSCKTNILLLFFSCILLFAVSSVVTIFPYGNLLYSDHIGILSLSGVKTLLTGNSVFLYVSNTFILISVFFLIFSCLRIIVNFLVKKYVIVSSKIFAFSLFMMFLIGYVLFLFYFRSFYDRYTLVSLVVSLFILLIIKNQITSTILKTIILIFLFLQLTYGMVTMRDYFQWNRTRAKALSVAINSRFVTKDRINAGLEWNRWFNYNKPKVKYNAWITAKKRNDAVLIKKYPLYTSFLIKSDSIFVYVKK